MTPSTLLMCRKRTTNPQTKADVNAIPVSLQASENNLDDGQTNPARNDQFTNPYTKLRLQLPGVHGAASGNDSEGSYYDEIADTYSVPQEPFDTYDTICDNDTQQASNPAVDGNDGNATNEYLVLVDSDDDDDE